MLLLQKGTVNDWVSNEYIIQLSLPILVYQLIQVPVFCF